LSRFRCSEDRQYLSSGQPGRHMWVADTSTCLSPPAVYSLPPCRFRNSAHHLQRSGIGSHARGVPCVVFFRLASTLSLYFQSGKTDLADPKKVFTIPATPSHPNHDGSKFVGNAGTAPPAGARWEKWWLERYRPRRKPTKDCPQPRCAADLVILAPVAVEDELALGHGLREDRTGDRGVE
jgi:hypothetical protein